MSDVSKYHVLSKFVPDDVLIAGKAERPMHCLQAPAKLVTFVVVKAGKTLSDSQRYQAYLTVVAEDKSMFGNAAREVH